MTRLEIAHLADDIKKFPLILGTIALFTVVAGVIIQFVTGEYGFLFAAICFLSYTFGLIIVGYTIEYHLLVPRRSLTDEEVAGIVEMICDKTSWLILIAIGMNGVTLFLKTFGVPWELSLVPTVLSFVLIGIFAYSTTTMYKLTSIRAKKGQKEL